jgi:hypothetical protein
MIELKPLPKGGYEVKWHYQWDTIRMSFLTFSQWYRTPDLHCVEVGVEAGENAERMLKFHPTAKFTLVDNYMDPNNAHRKNLMLECIKPFADRCEFWEMDSAEAAKKFPDKSLDYVYIDACHDYANVFRDLEAWYPKVKDMGMIAGHDWLIKDVQDAVSDFFRRNGRLCRIFAVDSIGLLPPFSAVECQMSDWWTLVMRASGGRYEVLSLEDYNERSKKDQGDIRAPESVEQAGSKADSTQIVS